MFDRGEGMTFGSSDRKVRKMGFHGIKPLNHLLFLSEFYIFKSLQSPLIAELI